MSKRVSNKKGEHQGARCRSKMGWRKRAMLNRLIREQGRLSGDAKEAGLRRIGHAIRKLMPKKREQRHQGR